MTEESGEKKIIIDEDWKAQAQAEKEALQKQAEAEKAKQSAAGGAEAAKAEAGPATAERTEAAGARGPLPPADFLTHIISLATQTMMLLGAMPNPLTGKQEVDLDQAKHLVDTLAMLQEKTQGNLTDEESQTLENLLHELRMGYVSVQGASKTAGGAEAKS